MSLQLQMEQLPGYLAARFIGAAAPGEVSQQYESIAEICERTKNNKLLIDATRPDVKLTVSGNMAVGVTAESRRTKRAEGKAGAKRGPSGNT